METFASVHIPRGFIMEGGAAWKIDTKRYLYYGEDKYPLICNLTYNMNDGIARIVGIIDWPENYPPTINSLLDHRTLRDTKDDLIVSSAPEKFGKFWMVKENSNLYLYICWRPEFIGKDDWWHGSRNYRAADFVLDKNYLTSTEIREIVAAEVVDNSIMELEATEYLGQDIACMCARLYAEAHVREMEIEEQQFNTDRKKLTLIIRHVGRAIYHHQVNPLVFPELAELYELTEQEIRNPMSAPDKKRANMHSMLATLRKNGFRYQLTNDYITYYMTFIDFLVHMKEFEDVYHILGFLPYHEVTGHTESGPQFYVFEMHIPLVELIKNCQLIRK